MSSRAIQAIHQITNEYVAHSEKCFRRRELFSLLSPIRFFGLIWDYFYILAQLPIVWFFKAPPPKTAEPLKKPRGRIAVIGSGVTGVSSAAHAISHGFEVVIFEAKPKLGGIWLDVNSTSSLQLNSLLYRFHPAVIWSRAFPLRDEILGEIRRIWKEYHLDTRTRFQTEIKSVKRASPPSGDSWDDDPDRSRWVINDAEDDVFDAVIVTVGTCGEPNWIKLPGMSETLGENLKKKKKKKRKNQSPTQDRPPSPETGNADHDHRGSEDKFTKAIVHSSQLDSPAFQLKGGERVVVIGSGASGVEAVETLLDKYGSVLDYQDASSEEKDSEKKQKKGADITVIARNDKWIIPRNIFFDTCIAGQPFGREMPLSFLWESFLRHWQYAGVEELTPSNLGIYESTPVVNDEFLKHVRTGRCHYVRGEPTRLTSEGVIVHARKPKRGAGKPIKQEEKATNGQVTVEEIPEGEEKLIPADVIVLATGYKKPTIEFLPDELFPEGYQRPDLYLQNFSTEDWSVLMTNSAYQNAIGTVHIGISWVDVLRFVKRGATGGALGFFTYMELTIWLLLFHIFRPDRLRWLFFIMNGWGVYAQE
ncbi:hypothetical protein CPB84DRAFT_1769451 [Gymnopilus junonius]|uniref:Flavin-containing monooxygenase n=1 Tax=Gymnopilus junonius TaxID=109634 RepID=A0A9P5NWT6_GYMJU|nr:hypothetical protein CPB84DRAFT_1769451 [Gymnopilus junonius]